METDDDRERLVMAKALARSASADPSDRTGDHRGSALRRLEPSSLPQAHAESDHAENEAEAVPKGSAGTPGGK